MGSRSFWGQNSLFRRFWANSEIFGVAGGSLAQKTRLLRNLGFFLRFLWGSGWFGVVQDLFVIICQIPRVCWNFYEHLKRVAKYTTSTGAQCKFLRIYRISEYFINEKICGPGPWRCEPAAQPGPWWTSGRRRLEGPEARRCACRSRASSQYGAWELTGGGGKERGERRGPFAGLTEAWRCCDRALAMKRRWECSSSEEGEKEEGNVW
jgi:hypothetical protein